MTISSMSLTSDLRSKDRFSLFADPASSLVGILTLLATNFGLGQGVGSGPTGLVDKFRPKLSAD